MVYRRNPASRLPAMLALCLGLLSASYGEPLPLEAGDRGDPRARYALALRLVKQSSDPGIVDRAVALLEQAARQGLPEAQFEYANWLAAGTLVPGDLVKASSYYRKAAEAGHQESRCRLCRIYSQIPSLKYLRSTERHCEVCAGAFRQPAPDDPAGLMPPARYSGCGANAAVATMG